MISLNENLKIELVNKLAQIPTVQKVILYGSRSRGDAGDRSDIDLAVETEAVDPRVWYDITSTLEDLPTLLLVDLVLLNEVTGDFRTKIYAEGTIIFDRSARRSEAH